MASSLLKIAKLYPVPDVNLLTGANVAPWVRRRRRTGSVARDPDGFWDFRSSKIAPFSDMPSFIKDGRSREGISFSGRAVNEWVTQWKWAILTERYFMNVVEELRANYDEAAALWKTYEERLTQFRSQCKNDVVSLEAAARKTEDAALRMNRAYTGMFEQLNGVDMMKAIENAERLAAALKALSELQAHRLTFAVLDSTKPQI